MTETLLEPDEPIGYTKSGIPFYFTDYLHWMPDDELEELALEVLSEERSSNTIKQAHDVLTIVKLRRELKK